MTKAFRSVTLFSLLCFLTLGVAWGQDPGNVPNLTTIPSDNFGLDSINLQNLSVDLSVPIISKPGAIPFGFSLEGSSACAVVPFSTNGHAVECGVGLTKDYGTISSPPWRNWLITGVSPVNDELGSLWTMNHTADTIITCSGTTHKLTGLYVTGPDQTTYPLPTADYIETGGCSHDINDYTVQGAIHVVTSSGIPTITFPNGNVIGLNTLTDPFGNVLSYSTATTSYTDTLGTTTFDITPSSRTTGTAGTYYWTDTGGTQRHVNGVVTSATIKTTFGCVSPVDQTYTGEVLSEIDYPDGNNLYFSYEAVTGGVTGRLHQITYRTTGTVQYTYGSLLSCNINGMIPSSLTRTSSDGATTYSVAVINGSVAGTYGTQTTILDPGKNKRVLTFMGADQWGNAVLNQPLTLTEVQTWQNTNTVASPTYTLLSTTIYCYNNNATACPTTQAAYPILHKDVYVAPGSKTTYSRTHYDYDNGCGGSCGLVTSVVKYASFVAIGAGTADNTTTISYGSWAGSLPCPAVGSGIVNLPCDVKTTAGANTLAESRYTYSSKGFATQSQTWTGSSWVSASASPNTNGTVASSTNPLGLVTSFTYGACNSMLPTATSKTVNSVVLTTGATWDCNMGKLLSATDANSNTAHFTYDLLGRPASQQDPANLYTLSENYPSATSSTLTDSTYFTTTLTVDGLGRPIRSQKTDGASYDTVSTSYGFIAGMNPQWQVNWTEPCITALGSDCSLVHASRTDPIGRQILAYTTSNENVATTYNQNDAATTLSPFPSGEHNKTVQTESDGMGRVLSTCALQTTGGTACGQIDGNSGILTSYTYAYGAGQTLVTATRGSQQHLTYVDAAGRLEQVQLPESGTTTFYYDTAPSACPTSVASSGNLTCTVDANGAGTIYVYDANNRLTDTNNGGACRRFRYDATSKGIYTAPTGYTANNIKGRILEASTDDCTFPFSQVHMITDEWFAYDDDGRITDVWETTPHSSGWYHSTAAYALNGQLTSLSGVASAYTIVLDSNGRPYTSKYGTTVVGNGTTYNAAGQATEIDTGTGGDKDVYTFDPFTGLMKTWAFTINSITENATLTWNANRTLKTLAITDGFNAGGTQTCHYNPTDATGSGYDDVGRLVGVNCGAPWTQTYTYDQYNNFSKSGTTNWNPTYSATNNHMGNGATYDSDGQVTFDTNSSYAWDGYHKMITANAGASLGSCGAAGVTCITYDAFGQPAEKNVGGTITEMLYSPIGLTGIMSGQTAKNFRVRIPGGAIFDGSQQFGNGVNHVDWLGSIRVAFSLGHTQILDTAYTPYGEKYASFGTGPVNFTGDYQNLYSGLYDTPNREFDTSSGSRWLSPDPARASWNAYAYPTNPNSMTDPSGLRPCFPSLCTSNNEIGPGDDGSFGGNALQFSWSVGGGSPFTSSIYRGSSNFGTYNVVQPAGYTTASPDGDLYTLTSTMKVTGTFSNGTNVIDLFTGRNVGNGFVKQTPSTLPHGGQHIKPSKNWTFRPLIQQTEWFYNVSGRKWTSDGDGPTSFSDSPDTWNQLETNKGIPAGDNIQVEPTKFLFDDGSGAGLKWVDVGAGAGAGAGLSLLDTIGIAMEGGPLVGAYSYGAWQYAQQGANFVEQGVIPVSSFGVPTQ